MALVQQDIALAKELQQAIEAAYKKLAISESQEQLEKLDKQALEPDFWNDNLEAQKVSKQIAKLRSLVEPWQKLKTKLEDILSLLEEESDASADSPLSEQVAEAQKTYDKLREQLKFTGIHDSLDAIVSIYAGAGGTDAQDWAEMLQRMYTRWAESEDIKVELLDESRGDEAGIKSVTLGLSGAKFIYGRLKSEHGVHRLVRLSPYNSDNLRQTSFAKVDVIPQVESSDELEIDQKDLRIDVYRSGGKGGQSVNTTDSAVRITHIPTNIVVSIQNERSQIQNKETALKILRSKLAILQAEQKAEHLSELKGPNQANEWGSQIRNYVLHPYKMVKDVRTGFESSDPDSVLDGKINDFISAYLDAAPSV